MKINEKIFIELKKAGKSDYEIAQLFKIGERTAQRYSQRLRTKKKIKSKEEIQTTNKLGLKDINNSNINKKIKEAQKIWTIPKGTSKKLIQKPFKIYLYTADQHIPVHSISANRAIHKLMEDIKFDGFRVVGDYMDMSPISHWNEHKRKTLETQRLYEDYAVGNVLLDEYDKRLPKNCDKAYFWGNHEDWYNQLIEKLPVLEGIKMSPTTELYLEKRGYKVYEKINYIERIGRLSVTHGVYANVHAVKKHIDVFKTNVMFFHTHRIGSRSDKAPGKEIAIVGYNVGCLCNKNPDFLKNKPNAWSHGFAIVYYMDNGYFFVQNIRIIKGRFVYNGKIYDGNV